DELRESIATRATSCRSLLLRPFCLVTDAGIFVEEHYLDRTELKRDVLRARLFYWRRGYREAQVDTTVARADDGVEITFRITEGPPTLVSSVTVLQSDSALTDRQVSAAMLLRAGEPLNLLQLDSSQALLAQALWNEGYADAELRDTVLANDTLRTAAVRIEVNPRWKATIGAIRVRGNEKIADRTIRNSLSFEPGDVYRRDDVIESQRSLYASNLFSHAVIIVPPQGDSVKLIEVTVQEAPLREARTSAGFNTVEFFQVEGRFTNYNFYGRARRLELRGVVGNLLAPQLNGRGIFRDVTPPTLSGGEEDEFLEPNWQLGATLTQPWFGSPRNSIGLELFAHRRSAPAIFIDNGYGASASFTRNLASRAPASATYRYEETEVQAGDVYFCVNYGVCEPATIGALRARNALAPLALSIFTDRTDDPLDPRAGYTGRADVEHASAFTLSDYRYNRAYGEGAIYRPVLKRSVLAARVRLGWVQPLGSTVEAVGAAIPRDAGEQILHP
ncbi:MAG: BamA/OMP85 family outer membrane protein, partial [Gemmatimonadaceae bacterium]